MKIRNIVIEEEINMEVVNSTNLQRNGVPRGKRLITEAEVRAMGRQELIDLEAITPVLHDYAGNTGSRIWWLYKTPVAYGRVNINDFDNFIDIQGINMHHLAILMDE